MNRHIAKKDLIALLSGLTIADTAARYNHHLESCEECRTRYNALEGLVRPFFRDRIRLNPGLRERILRDAVTGTPGKVIPLDIKARPVVRIPRWLKAIAAAVVITGIAGLLVLYLRPLETPVGLSLNIARISGEVTVDGLRQSVGGPVPAGARVVVGRDSAVDFVFEKTLSVTVPGDADLVVEKASRMKNIPYLRIRLERGMLLSRTVPGAGKIDYGYMTRHAELLPVGTEFILGVKRDATMLLLRKGSVNIRNAAGAVLNGREGYRYVITADMKEYPLSRDDMNSFDMIENSFGERMRPEREDGEKDAVRDADRISPPAGNAKYAGEKSTEGDAAVRSDAVIDAGKEDLRDERGEVRREVRTERNEMRTLRKGERRSGR